MKKKLFFYLFLIISIINTLSMASNPWGTQHTLNKSQLVFKNTNSELFINIFSYLKSIIENTKTPTSITKKNLSLESTPQEHTNTTDLTKKFSEFVKNVYTTDACLYYIDRGAVQEAKKNDHTTLFNSIKKKSSDLKNTIYQQIFLDKNGAYKTLINSSTIILQNLMTNNDLLTIPYAQVGVLPKLKQIVDAKINTFKQDHDKLLFNEQEESKELEEIFNKDKNSIQSTIKKSTDRTTAQIKKQQNDLADLKKKLDEYTSIFTNTQGKINELRTKITNLNTNISHQKNSLKDYDNLILINKKKNILANTKKLFENVNPVAKNYYTAYAKWEESTKGKGFFEQISSLVKDKPKELQDTANKFSQQIKTVLNNFKENMQKNNFPVTDIKGGFVLLQGIADQKDMLSEEKFYEIVNNIDIDLKKYEQLINEKNFYTEKTSIDKQESELTELSALLNNNETTVKETQEKVDRLNENINDLETSLARLQAHSKTTIDEHLKKIEDRQKQLDVDKKNIQIKYAAILSEYQKKEQDLYTSIDFSNIVKSYITTLKSLPFIDFQEKINNYKILIELFNLLPAIQNKISLEELNKKNPTDTLIQKVISFKQTTVEYFSNVYAQAKRTLNQNRSNKSESDNVSNEHIYYAFSDVLKQLIKANVKYLEENIMKIHNKLISLPINSNNENPIVLVSHLQLFYMLYAKPIYTLYHKLQTSIKKITDNSSSLSIKNNFSTFIQAIDEKTQQIISQKEINQINDEQSTKTAYVFFNNVAQVLKEEIQTISIPSNSIIDNNYTYFINKLDTLTQLITIIEQSQLIWYANSKDLEKLFDPVKKAILEKKNTFFNAISNEHTQNTTGTKFSKDFELINNKLTGILLEKINSTYDLLEKMTLIKVLLTPQERNLLLRNHHSAQWISNINNLITTLLNDEQKLNLAESLYNQTVGFLYEKIKQKNRSLNLKVIKKEETSLSTNPFD